MLVELLRYMTRKNSPIVFDDKLTTKPASALFGLDRGTPIDRYYIEKFLADKSDLIQGRVLEIAESLYSKRFGGDSVESFEILHATSQSREATIVGDLTDITTLPESSIDCFICTQTFNFIFDVQKAVQGACYLLKPGGVLLATVAGISQISRHDMNLWGDYWRFTTASIGKLFEPHFAEVEVKTFGNVLAATAFLQGIVVEDLPEPSLLNDVDDDYQLIIAVVARKA